MMKRTLPLIGIALATTLICSCGPGGKGSDGEVKWPALSTLDLQTEKAFAAVESATNAVPAGLLAGIKQGIDEVVSSPVPKNAKNPEQIKTLLGDLESLADTLDNPDDPALALEYVHDAILTIMETSGVPHKHDHDEHGHDGHDHDH